jgi:tetratricopeptide (TPR) repeat protein
MDAKGGWLALNPSNGATLRTGSLKEIIDMRFWDEKPTSIDNYAEAALFSGRGHLFVVGPSAISRINLKTFPGEFTMAGEMKTKRPENTMEQALERAIGEWDGKNFSKAAQLLREIAIGWPDSALSRLFLGMAYSSGGYFDEAVAELERAITIEPDNPDIAYNLVGNYIIKLYSLDPEKDADKIVELYNLAIAARPDFQMPYVGLAELYMNGRQPEMAVKTLVAAYRGAFFGRGLHDLLLGAYFMSGRREDTLAFADRVIKMFPDSDVAFQLKGKILSAEGKYKEAAAAFKKVPAPSRSGDASIYPRLLAAGSDFFHGNASGFSGNYAPAAELLLAYADALPSPEQVQKLIEIQEKLESDRSAAQDKSNIYKDAGIHPKFAGRHVAEIKAESEFKIPSLLSAAHFLSRAGKYKESSKVIDRVVKIGRADPDSMSQIGYLYALNNSNHREADAYTAKALEMDPNDPVYMRNRAVVLSRSKRNREALELFKKAIAAKPDTELLRFEYGQALLKDGKKKEAAEQFKLEQKRSPDLALAADALKKTGVK